MISFQMLFNQIFKTIQAANSSHLVDEKHEPLGLIQLNIKT